MNPYSMLVSEHGTSAASSLSGRLADWHDAMVVHERRLRARRDGEVCDEECPHGEARTLWPEALDTFGPRAHELTFLRSRAAAAPQFQANTAAGGAEGPKKTADEPHSDRAGRRPMIRDAGRRPVANVSLELPSHFG